LLEVYLHIVNLARFYIVGFATSPVSQDKWYLQGLILLQMAVKPLRQDMNLVRTELKPMRQHII
jgi:hypothetical protein